MSLFTEKSVQKAMEAEQYALIDALPQFVWVIRPDGSIAYTNRRWRDYSNLLSRQSREQAWSQHHQLDGCLPMQDKQHMLPSTGPLSEKEIWLQNLHPEDKKRVLALQCQVLGTRSPKAEERNSNGQEPATRWWTDAPQTYSHRR